MRLTSILLMLAVPFFSQIAIVSAQDATTQSIIDKLSLLERDLLQLQRTVFRDGLPQGASAPPDSVARDLNDTGASSALAARHETRISQLEEQLRTLTGQVEEVRFEMGQLRGTFDRLAADLDLRLTDIEEKLRQPPMTVATAENPAVPANPQTVTTTDQSGTVIIEADPNAERYESMGELGTVPAEEAVPADTTVQAPIVDPDAATAVAEVAGGAAGPQSDYDTAYGLLRQAAYPEAEGAFQRFVQTYPDHRLAANAYYWLGETYYVRALYENATVSFARGYKSDPEGNKAPDNLLKLGLSFMALGKNPEACATFSKLAADHGDAPKPIQDRVGRERKRAGCG